MKVGNEKLGDTLIVMENIFASMSLYTSKHTTQSSSFTLAKSFFR